MLKMKLVGSTLAALIGLATPVFAQTGTVDRLYVMDCGHNAATDQSRWSPGVNVGKPIELSDNCYLIHNPKGGYLLWDTGVAENIADMPDGLSQANGTLVWHKPKKLAAQVLDA